MRYAHFELLKSGLLMGILVVALCFQMLPFFFLILVIAFALGVSGAGLLFSIPVVFLALVVGVSWLASKRPRPVPLVTKALPRRWNQKPRQEPDVLMKTRAERYQDMKDILGQAWR